MTGTLGFDAVPFLLAIPVGSAILLLLLSRSRSELSLRRRVFSFLVRTAIVSLLLAAMAGPSWTQRVPGEPVTVYLLDVSESMGTSLAPAVERVEALSRGESARGRRTALVLFAGSAEIVRAPSVAPITVPADRRRAPGSDRTDFAEGLRVAETLALPSARYVFVTDGRDPLGTAPVRDDVAILVIPSAGRDVAVTGLHAPPAVRAGEPFDLRIDFSATAESEVEAFLLIDDVEVRRERIRVAEGATTARVRSLQPALSHGPHRVGVLVKSEGDAERRNNFAGTSVFALGRPRVLVVEDPAGAGDAVARMLRAHEFDVKRIPVSRLGDEPLQDYAAVVAAGVRAGSFGEARALREYVAAGGGFWLAPPPDPAAAAEYARSPIQEWLPVEFDPSPPKGTGRDPARPERRGESNRKETASSATVALLLLVDKSGSMAGDKLEIVKEACRVTADTLQAGDSVGVLAFDTKPHWVLEFTDPDRKEYIRDQIYRLLADGGTDIHPALVEAHRAMLAHPRARAAGIKHVILFSDGDTRPADIPTQVRRMAEAGISVSTVCILLQDFDLFLMKEIADLGKGRFRYTSSFAHVPKIFTEEARALLAEKRPHKEEEARPTDPTTTDPTGSDDPKAGAAVVPRILEPHEILWEGMPSPLPALRAIHSSKARPGARVPLGAEDRRPVLAVSRVGLGRAAVWTCDLEGRWSADWLRWAEAPKLFAHLVRHLSSASENLDFAERVEVRADRATVRVRIAPGPAGERLRLTRLQPRLEEVPLVSDAEGGRRAEFAAEGDPTQVLLTREEGLPAGAGAKEGGRSENLTLLVPKPYEPEFLPVPPLADRAIEGGRAAPDESRRTPLALWLILAAALLLPLDVALRRIR
ncbi:MAG: VWA domain-containing protein [Planctomycetes bacterium]|nr:VWA domain-containing protein [Planctomycetota bacterium]